MKKANSKAWLAALVSPALLAWGSVSTSPDAVRGAGTSCTAPATESDARAARRLVDGGEHEKGAELARSVLARCPSQAAAASALGEALIAQRKYEDAVERMTQVLRADDRVADAYLWRGYGYYHLGKPDRMVADMETFLKLAPEAPQAPAVRSMLARLRG